MPLITVRMFTGRTRQQKEELVRRLTDTFLEVCGRPAQTVEGVWVILDEIPPESWAVGGTLGAAAGDVGQDDVP